MRLSSGPYRLSGGLVYGSKECCMGKDSQVGSMGSNVVCMGFQGFTGVQTVSKASPAL